MRNFFLFGTLIIFCSGLLAQFEPEETITQESKNTTNPKDKLYFGFISAFLIDYINSPLIIYDNFRRDPQTNVPFPDSMVPYQTSYNSMLSIGIDVRYNIKELNDNLAFALSAPVTIGFGQAYPSNEDVDGAKGFGNFQIPLLAKMYLGTSATRRSTEDFGISIGSGLELNKLGIIALERVESSRENNKAWVMPVFSGSVLFWRGQTPVEVSVKYGVGQKQSYSINRYGSLLHDGERVTRANSIKVSFIYMFD